MRRGDGFWNRSDRTMSGWRMLLPIVVVAILLVIVVAVFIKISRGKDSAEEKPVISTEVGNEEVAEPNTQETSSILVSDHEQDPQNVFGGAMTAGENDGEAVPTVLSAEAVPELSGRSLGIDVSKFQGTIDWRQAADSGIEFAMVRVGYRTLETGEICEDTNARYNLQEAQANGLKVGAYFFSTAVTEEEAWAVGYRTLETGEICEDTNARYNLQEAQANGLKVGAYFFSTAVTEEEAWAEADWVADLIAQYRITYPVAYNCEGFTNPKSRQYEMTQSERTDIADAFLKRIYERGYTPMFYAAKNEMEGDAQWTLRGCGSPISFGWHGILTGLRRRMREQTVMRTGMACGSIQTRAAWRECRNRWMSTWHISPMREQPTQRVILRRRVRKPTWRR